MANNAAQENQIQIRRYRLLVKHYKLTF